MSGSHCNGVVCDVKKKEKKEEAIEALQLHFKPSAFTTCTQQVLLKRSVHTASFGAQ